MMDEQTHLAQLVVPSSFSFKAHSIIGLYLQVSGTQAELAKSQSQLQVLTSQLQQQEKETQTAQVKAQAQQRKLAQCQARLKSHEQLDADTKEANQVRLSCLVMSEVVQIKHIAECIKPVDIACCQKRQQL